MAELRLIERVDALARVAATSLPVLSLYLDTDIDGSGRPNHDLFLRKELRDSAKTYAERSTESEHIERDTERIESYVTRELKSSTRGLALFACAGLDLFEAIQLPVPFDRNRLVVSDRPHLYPLARLADKHPRYAAVVVDTNLARIFVFDTGRIVDAVQVQNAKTKHSKAGGWSQARFQRHVENVHLLHIKEVVERVDAIVSSDTIDHVVVAGDEVIVPLVRQQLPERLTSKLVEVLRLDIRSPEHEVLTATLDALRRKDEEVDEAVVHEVIGESRAGGLAVVEAEPVLAALRKGQVDTLVITAVPELVKGADRAANELVRLAKRTAASVRFIANPTLLADVGGVGASLRYLP